MDFYQILIRPSDIAPASKKYVLLLLHVHIYIYIK